MSTINHALRDIFSAKQKRPETGRLKIADLSDFILTNDK